MGIRIRHKFKLEICDTFYIDFRVPMRVDNKYKITIRLLDFIRFEQLYSVHTLCIGPGQYMAIHKLEHKEKINDLISTLLTEKVQKEIDEVKEE